MKFGLIIQNIIPLTTIKKPYIISLNHTHLSSKMQSKLPDLNSAIVTHRLAAIRAYDRDDLQKGIIEIRSIIALLPEDYKLKIDTDLYRAHKKAARKFQCGHCEEETDYSKIQIGVLNHTKEDIILLKESSYEVWTCPNCKKNNLVSETKSFLDKNPDPCYFGIIPSPPRKSSIFDRPGFDYSWKHWFEIAFPEIENQISKYRTDYVSQNDDDVIEENSAEMFDVDE